MKDKKKKKYRVGVLGAGSWGGTLAYLAALKGHDVTIWTPDKNELNILSKTRKLIRPKKLTFPKSLNVTGSMKEACTNADALIIVVPSKFYEVTIKEIRKQSINKKTIIISATKGLINEGKVSPHQVLEKYLPNNRNGVLSGPNIALDVISSSPVITVIASKSKNVGDLTQEILSTESFRVYYNSDINGVEIAGAFKNVIAIAAGLSDGFGFSISTKAGLMSRGLLEIIRLGKKEGAKLDTMYSAAGIGDLIATCCSPNSRNYRVGYALGKGKKLAAILKELGEVAEGVETARAMHKLGKKHKLSVPIADAVYEVVTNGKNPKGLLKKLLERPLPSTEIEY